MNNINSHSIPEELSCQVLNDLNPKSAILTSPDMDVVMSRDLMERIGQDTLTEMNLTFKTLI
jgi:hypothetical protein